MPLSLVMTLEPFAKWAIDFIGSITPPAQYIGVQYFIITTEYLTHWAQMTLVKDYNADTIVCFLFEHVLTCFGCLNIPMSK